MLKYYEYVYAVYQEKSFSRAAQKLFISQPALSSYVKKAEEQMGMILIDRSTNPIRLTPAGQCYIEAVEQILATENELHARVGELVKRREGTITVGAATYFCSYILPEVSREFQHRYPGYTMNIMEGNTSDLIQCLQSNIIDFVLNTDTLDDAAFERHVCGQEHLILAVPAALAVNESLKDFRLSFEEIDSGNDSSYSDKPSVGLEHFANEEFLLLTKGNDGHSRALRMCRNAGFKPKVSMYMDQMATSYHAAKNGLGITFVRAALLNHVKPTNQLWFYKIDDPDVIRNIFIYHRKDIIMPTIAKDFLDFMEEKYL